MLSGRIAIIDAGNIGATLARKFRAAGHEVRLANSRGPDSIKGLADEIGASASSVEGALHGAEVVVVSIPLGRISTLPKGLFASARKRDLALRKLGEAASLITNEDVVRLNRSLF